MQLSDCRLNVTSICNKSEICNLKICNLLPPDPADSNIWQRTLERLRGQLDQDEFRSWFAATAYASDSGDRITVWTPSESIRRHIMTHHDPAIRRALADLGRDDAAVRFGVSGFDDDDDD